MTRKGDDNTTRPPVPPPPTAGSTDVKTESDTNILPSQPLPRDVSFGDISHHATMLLNDLIRIHYALLKGDKSTKVYKTPAEAAGLASRLTEFLRDGRKYQLSGLKDVPQPFLTGTGRFFEHSGDTWIEKTDDEAKTMVANAIVEQFATMESQNYFSAELEELVKTLTQNCDPATKTPEDPSSFSAPRPCDILFLLKDNDLDDVLPYEQQSGNRHLLYLASLHVSGETNESAQRIEASFKIVTSKIEVNSGTELVTKTPRYVAQELGTDPSLNKWRELSEEELAELACLFTFEIFLEKQRLGFHLRTSLLGSAHDKVKPSEVPVDDPTSEDILFGRGGMTNGHPGNRVFRDIIALHRPDYVRASKMDKPDVARRLVRALRQGNPPRRFLKKHDDGKWYDVGDKVAAEKTSQGLRERSNAEKRQRSAIRESLKIRKVDLADRLAGRPPTKKTKDMPPNVLFYNNEMPLSLSMKDTSMTESVLKKTDLDSESEEALPPNAVDKDGNILVTDYDILCGRGGLTNHHRGNKRFRDIVALHRPDYVRATKIQKPSVARVIVRAIRNGDPPGRFLRKDEKTGHWIDVGDRKAAEKTSQALREKGEDEQKESVQSPAALAPKPPGGGKGGVKKAPAMKVEEKPAVVDSVEV